MLEKAIHMDAKDDLGCIWLAFEVVAEIIKANKGTEKEELPPTPPPPTQGEKTKPREVDQGDAYGDDGQGGETVISKQPPIYKVGDRAKLNEGPNAGQIVEVVYAGLPCPETGVQELELELVTVLGCPIKAE